MKKGKKLSIISPLLLLLFSLTIYGFTLINMCYIKKHVIWESRGPRTVSIIFIVLIHFFLILTIYCYFKTMFTNPGSPPEFWVF